MEDHQPHVPTGSMKEPASQTLLVMAAAFIGYLDGPILLLALCVMGFTTSQVTKYFIQTHRWPTPGQLGGGLILGASLCGVNYLIGKLAKWVVQYIS